jgi:hypothetical protein
VKLKWTPEKQNLTRSGSADKVGGKDGRSEIKRRIYGERNKCLGKIYIDVVIRRIGTVYGDEVSAISGHSQH